jgi:hypothetical protein
MADPTNSTEPPPSRVGREDFGKNLWRLLERYPGLTETVAYAVIWEAIYAREIRCYVPALKAYAKRHFHTWVHVPPTLEFHYGELVVTRDGLRDIHNDWTFKFEGRRRAIELAWLEILRAFDDRSGTAFGSARPAVETPAAQSKAKARVNVAVNVFPPAAQTTVAPVDTGSTEPQNGASVGDQERKPQTKEAPPQVTPLPDAIITLFELLRLQKSFISEGTFLRNVVRRKLSPSKRLAKATLWEKVPREIKSPEGRHSEDTKRRLAKGDSTLENWGQGSLSS